MIEQTSSGGQRETSQAPHGTRDIFRTTRLRNMKLLVVLALFTAVITAANHKCYKCSKTDPKPCKNTVDCLKDLSINVTALVNTTIQCFTSEENGKVSLGCVLKEGCNAPLRCCDKDLCNVGPKKNSAPVTPPFVLLLLGLTVLITLSLNQD